MNKISVNKIILPSLQLLLLLAFMPNITSAESYRVERLNGGEPIITAEMFAEAGATDREGRNINGATMIRLPDWLPREERAHPAAEYYLYFGHHGGRYIRMAWSATPIGPFTLYQVGEGVPMGDRGVLDMGDSNELEATTNSTYRVGGHISSPEVLVDDENRRFVLYFHGVGRGGIGTSPQYTMTAVSSNGLEFGDNILPCSPGNAYFRVFHAHGQAYAFGNGCTLWKAPEGTIGTDDQAIVAPEDFPLYERHYWDLLKEFREKIEGEWAVKMKVGIPKPPEEVYQGNDYEIRHCGVLPMGSNRFQVFYTVKKNPEDPPERIFMSELDATDPDWQNWTMSAAEEILQPEKEWEGADLPIEVSGKGGGTNKHELRDPYPFRDSDGSIYLYYSGRGEDAIGVARLSPRGGSAVIVE